MLTIEIPQIFPVAFHFNTQEVGLQFLGIIIGSILGEQFGGLMSVLHWIYYPLCPRHKLIIFNNFRSDRWMAWRAKRNQYVEPEFRIWLNYVGVLLAICGIVVFLLQLGQIKHYNVTPIVGAAIAAGGNQIVTTVMVTYAVDCYREEAASVGVSIPAHRACVELARVVLR